MMLFVEGQTAEEAVTLLRLKMQAEGLVPFISITLYPPESDWLCSPEPIIARPDRWLAVTSGSESDSLATCEAAWEA